jgi:hypothetical protein
MSNPIVWHGTRGEFGQLLEAVGKYRTCATNAKGERTATCEPHRMVVEDQRAVDGLLFARRIAGRLRREEQGARTDRQRPGALHA